MGDLAGRTFLITGANTGIGKETARALASRDARVYLACRSQEPGRRAIEEISAQTGNPGLQLLALDLGDLASVRRCAEEFLATGEPLHVLINNAGVAGARGMTESGFERTFGTNHVGPFLLTSLLLDRLRASAPARIVNVASVAHYEAPGIDWQAVRRPTRTITGMREYSGIETRQRAPRPGAGPTARGDRGHHVRAPSGRDRIRHLAPGAVAGALDHEVAHGVTRARREDLAVLRHLPEVAGESGRYYDDCRAKEPAAAATAELASELWRRSSEWTEQTVSA